MKKHLIKQSLQIKLYMLPIMLKTIFFIFNKSKKFIQITILRSIALKVQDKISLKISQDYWNSKSKPKDQKDQQLSLLLEEHKTTELP